MTFHKYVKIKLFGNEENEGIFADKEDEIVIEEKIDGANFRFMIKDGEIIFGSRTQQLHEDTDHEYSKNFRRAIKFIQEKYDAVADIAPNLNHLIFYGENCVRHTMPYDWENMPPFLGFDIYSLKENKFLGIDDVETIFCKNLHIPIVPIISKVKAREIKKVDESLIPESKYFNKESQDKLAEGIVFKNYDKQIFAKIVREKFKESNRKTFGGSKKYATTDDEYFVAVYCTNARIDKIIFKLLDEDRKLGMEIMGDLLNRVYKDIWEEHWNEIAFSKKRVDLLKLKQLVSRRCLEVLKQFITNNALNKEGK